ncbi:MAG: hypothetical protein V1716_01425 [Candidatus Uhrbacteria bacterium]
MGNLPKEGTTPIGVQENGEIFSLSLEERSGILNLFGRSGQGKSLTIENIVISDILNGRSGLLIEPYGDLIKEIQLYVPADKIKVFETQAGTLEENIARFQQEIDFSEMTNGQLFILCQINYQALGGDLTKDFGDYLVKQFLKVAGCKNCSLMIDEAHNSVSEEILEQVFESKEEGLSCLFSDQSFTNYRAEFVGRLFEVSNHLICYLLNPEIADLLNKYNPDMSSDELTKLEQYHFLAKFNAKTATPTIIKLKGIFPIPFSKK